MSMFLHVPAKEPEREDEAWQSQAPEVGQMMWKIKP